MPSNWAALKAFAKLQWRANRAALRGGGRRAFATGFSIVGSLALGGVGLILIPVVLRLMSPGPDLTAVLVGGAALVFVVTTAIATIVGVNNSLDVRVLATEPLTRFQVAVGQLAMEAAGPTGIAMMLAGTGVVIGTAGGVLSIPLAVAAVATLLVANMLVARVVINLLSVLVDRAPRIGQFVSALAGLAIMAGYQVAANVLPRTSRARLRSITDVIGRVPGGSIGRALAGATDGGIGSLADWANVAWTAIWIPLLVWLFVRTTERILIATPGVNGGVVRERVQWRRWFGSGPSGAIAARTVVTTLRAPRRVIELTMGFAVGAAGVIVPSLLADDTARAVVVTGFGTCFAVILPLSNMFGADGPAIANELLAGATSGDMIRGKHRYAIAVGLPLVVIGPLVVAVVTGRWSLWPVYTLLAFAGVFGGSAVAIVQSSWAPVPVPENVNPFSFGGSSSLLAAVTWFVSLMVLSGVMAPPLIAVAIAAWFGQTAVAVVAAAVAAVWAYGASRLGSRLALGLLGPHSRLIDQITPGA